jgi:hypothetical protein
VREVGEAGRSNPALHCCFLRPSPTAYKERFFPKLLREPLEGPGPVKSKWRGFSPPETALGLTSLMKNNNNAKTRLVWNHKQICCLAGRLPPDGLTQTRALACSTKHIPFFSWACSSCNHVPSVS